VGAAEWVEGGVREHELSGGLMAKQTAFMQVLALTSAVVLLAACEKRQPPETLKERQARQLAEYQASPDIKGEELRKRLIAAGIPSEAMTSTLDDYQEEVLALKVDQATFDRLDKPKLAKLVLDSRSRFEFVDSVQVRAFAHSVGAETNARDEAKAIAELKARGELDKIPRYHVGDPMRSFANRLETYCGIEPGKALVVEQADWLNWNNEGYPREIAQAGAEGRTAAQLRSLESFDCLKRIIDATKVRRHFIGNRGREGAIDY
jgi:hypothetical protein